MRIVSQPVNTDHVSMPTDGQVVAAQIAAVLEEELRDLVVRCSSAGRRGDEERSVVTLSVDVVHTCAMLDQQLTKCYHRINIALVLTVSPPRDVVQYRVAVLTRGALVSGCPKAGAHPIDSHDVHTTTYERAGGKGMHFHIHLWGQQLLVELVPLGGGVPYFKGFTAQALHLITVELLQLGATTDACEPRANQCIAN